MQREKRFLFIGAHHAANEFRLARMQAKAVRESLPQVRCFYMGVDSDDPEGKSNEYMEVLPMPTWFSFSGGIRKNRKLIRFARHIRSIGIDLVQVSDAEELLYGYCIRRIARIPVIYDSHEDYFNQKYEYGGKTAKALAKGMLARAKEIALVRKMDAVFCTDEYLVRLYSRFYYGATKVDLLRNLPDPSTIEKAPEIHDRGDLRLVYAGGVNPYRGVGVAADFVERFNSEKHGCRLRFDVYAPNNAHLKELVSNHQVNYRGYLPQKEMMQALREYDVGVCLWQKIKKFERNIPIKNFEYMATGLPVLTSDFGQMQRYISESRAGIAIPPDSYEAFRDAVLRLADPDFRRLCGERGIAYTRTSLSRAREIAPYLDTVRRLLGI